jgi:hypothetical protein
VIILAPILSQDEFLTCLLQEYAAASESTCMSLGRKLRLDDAIRREPAMRWQGPLVFHILFAAATAAIAFSDSPRNPDGPTKQQAVMLVGGIWLVIGVAIEVALRHKEQFELQLLPGAVRLKNWSQDVLLIEPEIVGGRIGWFSDQISLRSGNNSCTIRLSQFNKHKQAAIIEHCSQFLTNEQQALFGREWAERYYRLLAPRKPPKSNPLHLLIVLTTTFAVGTLVLVTAVEYCVAHGAAPSGHNMRWSYLAWFVCFGFWGGLLTMLCWREQREENQLLISKIASTSTAAPVGSAAKPSAERAW